MLGALLQWFINAWVRFTGRKVSYDQYPWLRGPVLEGNTLADDYYQQYAVAEGLEVITSHGGGLLEDFKGAIDADAPDLEKLLPAVVDFYEHTSRYKLEVWSQWYGPIAFFARNLVRFLSRRMNQLNIPLYPLETSRGMSNGVIWLREPDGRLRFTCWLRKSILSGRVVYAGFYSACTVGDKRMVKVVFPLPDGNVTVLLHVQVQPDGSVKLLSHGKGLGDAGYYRLRHLNPAQARIKYIPLKESIHVFVDEFGVSRTDHEFWFLRIKFLHLHYKMMRDEAARS
jgi:hypothetical protein